MASVKSPFQSLATSECLQFHCLYLWPGPHKIALRDTKGVAIESITGKMVVCVRAFANGWQVAPNMTPCGKNNWKLFPTINWPHLVSADHLGNLRLFYTKAMLLSEMQNIRIHGLQQKQFSGGKELLFSEKNLHPFLLCIALEIHKGADWVPGEEDAANERQGRTLGKEWPTNRGTLSVLRW